MNKRKVLGKGLEALISSNYSENDELTVQSIEIDRIKPNLSQPRQNFDEEELQELAISIQSQGLLQPIIVMPDDDQFEILVGERRWRAAKIAGLTKIDAIVRKYNADEQLILQLIENIQRTNLNPVEEAKAYKTLMENLEITQEELASRLGKSRTAITNTIRLLKLPEQIQADIIFKRLSEGHARTLLALKEEDFLLPLRNKAVEEKWSVRRLEEITSLCNNHADRIRLALQNIDQIDFDLLKSEIEIEGRVVPEIQTSLPTDNDASIPSSSDTNTYTENVSYEESPVDTLEEEDREEEMDEEYDAEYEEDPSEWEISSDPAPPRSPRQKIISDIQKEKQKVLNTLRDHIKSENAADINWEIIHLQLNQLLDLNLNIEPKEDSIQCVIQCRDTEEFLLLMRRLLK